MASVTQEAYVELCNIASGGSTGAQAGKSVTTIFQKTGGAHGVSGGSVPPKRPSVLFIGYTKPAASNLQVEWSLDGSNWFTKGLFQVIRGEAPLNTATSSENILMEAGSESQGTIALSATTADKGFQVSAADGTGTLTTGTTRTEGFVKIPNPPPYIRINATAVGSGSSTVARAFAM